MLSIATRILLTACALILVAKLIPGITVSGAYPAIIAALILGILNVLVRPVLVILTLPLTLLTLGLFIFVINAVIFWFVASFVDGFHVDGFLPAFVGSLIVSIISSVINKFV